MLTAHVIRKGQALPLPVTKSSAFTFILLLQFLLNLYLGERLNSVAHQDVVEVDE